MHISSKNAGYRKDFEETKFTSFLIKDDELLEKYNEVWEKAKDPKREFDSKPVYNKKYLRAKIKYCKGKTNKNFHNNKIPKEDSQYICLSVILIDSVFRTGKNYYSQVFLEECNYVIKEKTIYNYIIDDVEISSDSDEETMLEKTQREKNSDEKILVQKILIKKILMKKI